MPKRPLPQVRYRQRTTEILANTVNAILRKVLSMCSTAMVSTGFNAGDGAGKWYRGCVVGNLAGIGVGMARPVDTDGAEDMDRTGSLILGGREARALQNIRGNGSGWWPKPGKNNAGRLDDGRRDSLSSPRENKVLGDKPTRPPQPTAHPDQSMERPCVEAVSAPGSHALERTKTR